MLKRKMLQCELHGENRKDGCEDCLLAALASDTYYTLGKVTTCCTCWRNVTGPHVCGALGRLLRSMGL